MERSPVDFETQQVWSGKMIIQDNTINPKYIQLKAAISFHKVKIETSKTLRSVFEKYTNTKGLSCSQVAKHLRISRTTVRPFTHKVRQEIKSNLSGLINM